VYRRASAVQRVEPLVLIVGEPFGHRLGGFVVGNAERIHQVMHVPRRSDASWRFAGSVTGLASLLGGGGQREDTSEFHRPRQVQGQENRC
jgi:hypothetical protein